MAFIGLLPLPKYTGLILAHSNNHSNIIMYHLSLFLIAYDAPAKTNAIPAATDTSQGICSTHISTVLYLQLGMKCQKPRGKAEARSLENE
jgi:hypothetical protein